MVHAVRRVVGEVPAIGELARDVYKHDRSRAPAIEGEFGDHLREAGAWLDRGQARPSPTRSLHRRPVRLRRRLRAVHRCGCDAIREQPLRLVGCFLALGHKYRRIRSAQ